MILENKELMEIQGGAVNAGIVIGIISAVVFVIGVIDGFVNPIKCNNKK